MARSLIFRRDIGLKSRFVSRETFIFHLETGMGIASTGSERILTDFILTSIPDGAFSESARVPDTSMVSASFKSFREKSAAPGSYTHCSSPSLFLRMTKAIGPISRMVWIAPFTFTSLPSRPGLTRSEISIVSFCSTPVKNSIILVSFFVAGLQFPAAGRT